MAGTRPDMAQAVVYTTPPVQQTNPAPQQQPEPQKQSWGEVAKAKTNSFIHGAWTVLCFVVFCGFSFFMGWHSRGWHFSAYYDSPSVSYVGAKPETQISQAVSIPSVRVPH